MIRMRYVSDHDVAARAMYDEAMKERRKKRREKEEKKK